MGLDWVGYLATAFFASSYFFRDARAMRIAQALAALVWIVYGTLIHAMPLIASNALVAALAVWSSFIRRPRTD
jgi:hypothetical protein